MRKGDKVKAYFRGDKKNKQYTGIISRVRNDGTLDIAYDDGDTDVKIAPEMVQALDNDSDESRSTSKKIKVGSVVMCKFRGKSNGKEFKGKVVAVKRDKIDVDYEDGDQDKGIPMSAARLISDKSSEEESSDEEESSEAGDVWEELAGKIKATSNGMGKLRDAFEDAASKGKISSKKIKQIFKEQLKISLTTEELSALCNNSDSTDVKTLLQGFKTKRNPYGKSKQKNDSEEDEESEDSESEKEDKRRSSKRSRKGKQLVSREIRNQIASKLASKPKLFKKFLGKSMSYDNFRDLMENELELDGPSIVALQECFDFDGTGSHVDAGAFVYACVAGSAALYPEELNSVLNKCRSAMLYEEPKKSARKESSDEEEQPNTQRDGNKIDSAKVTNFRKALSDADTGKSGFINDAKQLKSIMKQFCSLKSDEVERIISEKFFQDGIQADASGSEPDSSDNEAGKSSARRSKAKRILDKVRIPNSSREDVKVHIDKLLVVCNIAPRTLSSVEYILQSSMSAVSRRTIELSASRLGEGSKLEIAEIMKALSDEVGLLFSREEYFIIFRSLKQPVAMDTKLKCSDVLKWFADHYYANPASKNGSARKALSNFMAKCGETKFRKLFQGDSCSRSELASVLGKVRQLETGYALRYLLEVADPQNSNSIEIKKLWKTFGGESKGDIENVKSRRNRQDSDSSASDNDQDSDAPITSDERLVDVAGCRKSLWKYAKRVSHVGGISPSEILAKNLSKIVSDEVVGARDLEEFLQETCGVSGSIAKDMVESCCYMSDESVPYKEIVEFGCDIGWETLADDCKSGLNKLRKGFWVQHHQAALQKHDGLLDDRVPESKRIRTFLKARDPRSDFRKLLKGKTTSQLIVELAKKHKLTVPPNALEYIRSRLDKHRKGLVDASKFLESLSKLAKVKLTSAEEKDIIYHFADKRDPTKVPYERIVSVVQPAVKKWHFLKKCTFLDKRCKSRDISMFPSASGKKSGVDPLKMIKHFVDIGLPLSGREIVELVNLCEHSEGAATVNPAKFKEKLAHGFDDSDDDEGSDGGGASSDDNMDPWKNDDKSTDASEDDESDNKSKKSKKSRRERAKNWISKLRRKDKSRASDEEDDDSDEEESDGDEVKESTDRLVGANLRKKFLDTCREYQEKQKKSLCIVLGNAFRKLDVSSSGTVPRQAFLKTINKNKLLSGASKTEQGALTKGLAHGEKDGILYEAFLELLYPSWNSKARHFIEDLRKKIETNENHKIFMKAIGKLKTNDLGMVDVIKVLEKVDISMKRPEKAQLTTVLDPYGSGVVDKSYFASVVGTRIQEMHLEDRLNAFFRILDEKKVSFDRALDKFVDSEDEEYMSHSQLEKLLKYLGIPISDPDMCVLVQALRTDDGDDQLLIAKLEKFAEMRGTLKIKSKSGGAKSGLSDSEDESSEASSENAKKSVSKRSKSRSKSPTKRSKSPPKRSKSPSKKKPFSSSDEDEMSGSSGSESSLSDNDDSTTGDGGFSEDGSSRSKSNSSSGASASSLSSMVHDQDSDASRDSDLSSMSDQERRGRSRQRGTGREPIRSAYDKAYDIALEKMLRRAFTVIDEDRSGYIESKEIMKIMAGLGKEATHEDVKSLMKMGDTNRDGKLDRKEFLSLMKNLIRRDESRLFPHREQNIRELFRSFDTNGDGTLSRHEFAVGLASLLGRPPKKSETRQLLGLADKDNDGFVSYDEFITLLRDAGNHGLSKTAAKTRDLLREVARGPVPDVATFLKTFAKMPANARPALLKELDTSMDHSLDRAIRGSSIERSVSKKGDVGQQSFIVSIRTAAGIPVIEPSKEMTIIDRRVRVCLWESSKISIDDDAAQDDSDDDTVSRRGNKATSTSLNYISNGYTMRASWSAVEEDVWKFSDKSDVSTFVIRVSDVIVDEAMSRGQMVYLLVELITNVEVSRERIEVACGWGSIPIPMLGRVASGKKRTKLQVMGGTPQHPTDILESDVKNRRKGWRAVMKFVKGTTSVAPQLRLRCMSTSMYPNQKVRQLIGILPVSVILPFASLPLVQAYRELRSTTMGTTSMRCDPVMRVFPLLMQDAEMLTHLLRRFIRSGGTKTKNREKRLKLFTDLVLGYWPLLVAADKKDTIIDPLDSGKSKRKSYVDDSKTDLFFAAKSKRKQAGESLKAQDLLFKPFDISETVVM